MSLRNPFFTTDFEGMTHVNPTPEQRLEILKGVLEEDAVALPEVYLTDESGHVLGYRAGGVLFEEEEGEVVRIIPRVSPEEAGRVWTMLLELGPEAIRSLPWQEVDF